MDRYQLVQHGVEWQLVDRDLLERDFVVRDFVVRNLVVGSQLGQPGHAVAEATSRPHAGAGITKSPPLICATDGLSRTSHFVTRRYDSQDSMTLSSITTAMDFKFARKRSKGWGSDPYSL